MNYLSKYQAKLISDVNEDMEAVICEGVDLNQPEFNDHCIVIGVEDLEKTTQELYSVVKEGKNIQDFTEKYNKELRIVVHLIYLVDTLGEKEVFPFFINGGEQESLIENIEEEIEAIQEVGDKTEYEPPTEQELAELMRREESGVPSLSYEAQTDLHELIRQELGQVEERIMSVLVQHVQSLERIDSAIKVATSSQITNSSDSNILIEKQLTKLMESFENFKQISAAKNLNSQQGFDSSSEELNIKADMFDKFAGDVSGAKYHKAFMKTLGEIAKEDVEVSAMILEKLIENF